MSEESQSPLNQLRRHAQEILQAALHAVDPFEAVRRHVRLEGDSLHVGEKVLICPQRVYVVGFGKAAAPKSHALEEIMGERVSGGKNFFK